MSDGEHGVEVTRETFQKWANRLHESETDRYDVKRDMSIDPSLFCALIYIKNELYVHAEEAPEGDCVQRMPMKNIELYKTWSLRVKLDIWSPGALGIWAMHMFNVDEEWHGGHSSFYGQFLWLNWLDKIEDSVSIHGNHCLW